MRTGRRITLAGLVLGVVALIPGSVLAVVPIAAPPPTLVLVTINGSPGDQNDPHVSGDWATYTDDIAVRYYNFISGIDAQIPFGPSSRDLLSDVSGSRIVFSRVITGVKSTVMVFDAATPAAAPVEIDPAANSTRLGSAIGGNTVAYIDYTLGVTSDLVIHDLASTTSVRITNDTAYDQNPSVSPDGNVVTWEHCLTNPSNCDIWQAVKTGPSWSVSPVADTASPEGNPDTNGALVVYDSALRPGDPEDLFWRPVAGGAETQLQMPGYQNNPSIAGNLIAFESRLTFLDATDIFVYDLVTNHLFQVTNTPGVNEFLSDITVLPGGGVRVVWRSNDSDGQNIKAATFQLPAVDSIAPVLSVPGTITVDATGPAGAVVTYAATATDNVTPNPTVSCVPASGSTFPSGTTTVTCTATDAAGNSSTASFNVVVRGASTQIASLISLVQSFNLKQGIANSLDVKLQDVAAALSAANAGDKPTACNKLSSFISEVQAQSGKALTTAEATQLIAAATQIETVMGCP